jgi:glutathione synthase/RimK-type ligase-like ATP-grasp enzyme
MRHVELWLFTLEVLPHGSSKKQLLLNNHQLEMFSLTPGQTLTLQVGVTESVVEVAIQMIHSSPTTLYLSRAAFKDFPYYQGEPLRQVFLSNRKLVLGPTLGLTVSKNSWENIDKSDAIAKIALLALEKGMLFYCFRLNSVDWDNNLVEAYCFNKINYQWVKKTLPVPQVIHDRGSYPGPKTVQGYPNRGKVHNIQWINTTRTFGKWETFQALRFFRETTEYLPETTLLTLSKLTEFLKKYQHCFIKSNYGRSGRQVFRIEKAGKYYLCKTGGSAVKSWKFTNLEKLCTFLHKNLGENLILQQGILLAQIGDSPFDMRMLVQKNASTDWIISALNFRIAKPGAITTNFAAGARDVFIAPGEDLLHAGLSWETLEHFALQTVCAMETFFGSLGEIGLDVGLDRQGKLWLIEANSRPSSIAYRKANSEVCKQIFGLPLDYASSLIRRIYDNLGN